MSKKIKTEGIVLKKRSLPNKDNIVTFFSSELGKIVVFAKGIKTITSRRLPHIQTANLVNITASKNKDRLYLQEASLISGFSQIKKNSHKMSLVYFMFYILDRLLPENQKEIAIYRGARAFLIDIARKEEYSVEHLEKYLNALLQSLGYIDRRKSLPQLKQIIEELTNEKVPLYII